MRGSRLEISYVVGGLLERMRRLGSEGNHEGVRGGVEGCRAQRAFDG
jgi:hypothetical protein